MIASSIKNRSLLQFKAHFMITTTTNHNYYRCDPPQSHQQVKKTSTIRLFSSSLIYGSRQLPTLLLRNNNHLRQNTSAISQKSTTTTTASPWIHYHNRSLQQQQVRTFFPLPNFSPLKSSPLSSQPQPGIVYIEERIMGYTPSQVFNVVANVNNYKLFLPHVKDSIITTQNNGEMEAVLTVGYPPFYESYLSHIRFSNPHFVNAESKSGKLFSHLRNRWEMHPVYPGQHHSSSTASGHHLHHHHHHEQHHHASHQAVAPHATRLKFLVEFEFASQWYQTVANMFFKFLVNSMTDAFEKRCREVYGPPSIPSKKIYDKQISLDEYKRIQQQHKQKMEQQQKQQMRTTSHQHHPQSHTTPTVHHHSQSSAH